MNLKEIKDELGITAENMKHFKKESLLFPPRSLRIYRGYSEEEFKALQKEYVLRKLGLTYFDIIDLVKEKLSLKEVAEKKVTHLKKRNSKLNGAIEVLGLLGEKEENFKSFDADKYISLISDFEKEGKRFKQLNFGIKPSFERG